MYYTLNLYHTLQKDEVPAKQKAIILGTLGYFILPIDLIPDLMPVVGTRMITLAVASVSFYIDEEVKLSSNQKMMEWFSLSVSECDKLV